MSGRENPPIPPKEGRPHTNQDSCPNQRDLRVLHVHSPVSNPLVRDFDYAEEYNRLDVEALRQDVVELMTSSQPWWPADYGHYDGLFIRMRAGTPRARAA